MRSGDRVRAGGSYVKRMAFSRTLAAIALVAIGPSACFIGYDSRWGEAKRAQQRVAAQSAPAAISASSGDAPSADAARHVWRVRLRPTAQYLAQTVNAPKQIADLLEDVNRVLEPSLALHLDMDRLQPWSRDGEDKMGVALGALRTEDAGDDVELVVGMIGGLSRQTDSFHELGMADMPGKHLVVRAAARADEHDAIDRSFYELSEDQRAQMIRLRKRHRALAVFLHEVGHCLGALHERDVHSLMNPAYDPKMSGFDDGALALMRVALAGGDRAAIARGQLALLHDGSFPAWSLAERDEEAARLQAVLDASAGAAKARTADTPVVSAVAVPPELSPGDADRFTRAQQALQASSARVAYEQAKPLFDTYPNSVAVQDLRCSLAAIRWLSREELLAECAPFQRLSAADGGAGSAR
jgi:hypothetical protein